MESLSPDLADDEAERYEHPWAARTTYETVSAPWLLGRAQPGSCLALQFTSSTTFKSGGLHLPVPLPWLVVGGLLERWNAFAPVGLPPEARRFAEECLALTAYRLSTRMIPVKEGGLRAGGAGKARCTAINRDRCWLSVMNLLADSALFAGVGAGTGMGLGQCRRIPNRGSGRTERTNGPRDSRREARDSANTSAVSLARLGKLGQGNVGTTGSQRPSALHARCISLKAEPPSFRRL